jgi:hypothetical protein
MKIQTGKLCLNEWWLNQKQCLPLCNLLKHCVTDTLQFWHICSFTTNTSDGGKSLCCMGQGGGGLFFLLFSVNLNGVLNTRCNFSNVLWLSFWPQKSLLQMKFTNLWKLYTAITVLWALCAIGSWMQKDSEAGKSGLYDGVRWRVTATEEFHTQWTDELITKHQHISQMSKLASYKDVWIILFILLVIERYMHDRFLACSCERRKLRDLNFTATFVAR